MIRYTIPSLYKALLYAHDKVVRANIIILDIGGNDLTDNTCDEFILHEMMLALIRHIRSVNSFATLIVFQLLHRLHSSNKSINFLLHGATDLVYVAVMTLPQNIISMLMLSILC